MQWRNFEYRGVTFDLSHLHPECLTFERPGSAAIAPIRYRVDVTYSLHCFSRRPQPDDDEALTYPASERRIFDLKRYAMSKRLPAIIRELPERKIRHTSHGNYITVDVTNEAGTTVEYDVFFRTRKPSRGRIELRVESAYIRDASYQTSRPGGKPIRFWVILHNTLNSLTIRS